MTPSSISRPPCSPEAPSLGLPRVLAGRYVLGRLLARGGVGRVYEAEQRPLGRRVAVKVAHMPPGGPEREVWYARWLREAQAGAQLDHPHSVTVLDVGVEGTSLAYLVMEFVEGETLSALLQREGRLPASRAAIIAGQIAWAMSTAHAGLTLHRDLKPANILVQALPGPVRALRDFIKVVDFGLAKRCDDQELGLTETGRFLGSPGYMAPEQIMGGVIDARCDQYALGAMLYEMLTGLPVFTRPTPFETMMAHVHEPLPPLADRVPAAVAKEPAWRMLAQVAKRALHKDPAHRFVSMAAMHRALMLVEATAAGSPARPVPTRGLGLGAARSEVPHPARRHRLRGKLTAMALVGAALFTLGGISVLRGAEGRLAQHGVTRVHLSSAPAGATVYLGNTQLCAATPCQVFVGAQEAASIRFVHPQFDEYVALRRLGGRCQRVHAPLVHGPK